MKTKLLLVFFLCVLQSYAIYASQSNQFSVTGKVVDRNNVPLPGVSIVIKGTTQGTTTIHKESS